MKKLHLIWFAAVLALGAIVACEDETSQPIINGKHVFEDLSEKWHVLNNLERAYNERRIDKYDELLDENFTFFLSTGDVGGGLPASWDRLVEVTANSNLFSSNPPDPIPLCKSIDLDVKWEDENGDPALTWVEQTMPGDETWYTTTVFYNYKFEVEPDMTYINASGARAQFTVRNAGTEEAPHWTLVEMRDLGDPGLVVSVSSATESTTWGSVKALYR